MFPEKHQKSQIVNPCFAIERSMAVIRLDHIHHIGVIF